MRYRQYVLVWGTKKIKVWRETRAYLDPDEYKSPEQYVARHNNLCDSIFIENYKLEMEESGGFVMSYDYGGGGKLYYKMVEI